MVVLLVLSLGLSSPSSTIRSLALGLLRCVWRLSSITLDPFLISFSIAGGPPRYVHNDQRSNRRAIANTNSNTVFE